MSAEPPDNPSLEDADNLRAIADDTYDWETWFASDGRALWTNPAVERMTGVGVEDCLALPDYPLPLIHPDDRERIAAVLRGACAGSSGNDLEFRLEGPAGGERWVAMSWQSTVNRRGEALGFRTSVRNIHDRKQLELQLREALAEARAAQRVKDEFLAMMSHELRTPLQCIQGHAELMNELAPRDDQRPRLDVILGKTELLTGMLENILELSALQAGAAPLDLHAVGVGQLVADICESLRPRAERAGLGLRLQRGGGDGRRVRTDARALQHVVVNLVHNAIKFTSDGEVNVRTVVEPVGGDRMRVRVDVQDTGPGIDPALQARIFEPFVQGTATGCAGGSGLGLAIARRLCDAIGAELHLRSGAGEGTRFLVELVAPVAADVDRVWTERRGEAIVDAIGTEFADAHPLRILLVEDSQPARELLAEVLGRHGYSIDQAATGPEAVARMQGRRYDLVLLDLHLPGFDGVSVLRRVARDGAGLGDTRVVALTAGVVAGSRAELLDEGFHAVVLKPVGIGRLQRLLRWAAGHDAGVPEGPPLGDPAARAQGLNPQVLWDLDRPTVDGDTLLRRTAARVRAQLPHHRGALGAALRVGPRSSPDADAMARAAHAVRGDCALIGAVACADAAAAVERLALAGAAGELGLSETHEVRRLLRELDALDGLLAPLAT